MTPPEDEPVDAVGDVGEEAAKLMGALSDWANQHLGDRLREVDEHIATGDAECRYCPVCRTVHAVRHASPETRAQLAGAAATFLQAAAGLLTAVGSAGPPPSRVEHIDLDAADPEEDAP